MTDTVWTVHDIARHTEWTVGSARVWVSEQVRTGRLSPVGRTPETGAKLYPREQVLAALAARPGQGRRTDLRSRHDDQHDEDPPT